MLDMVRLVIIMITYGVVSMNDDTAPEHSTADEFGGDFFGLLSLFVRLRPAGNSGGRRA